MPSNLEQTLRAVLSNRLAALLEKWQHEGDCEWEKGRKEELDFVLAWLAEAAPPRPVRKPPCEHGDCPAHYGDEAAWCSRCASTFTLCADCPEPTVCLDHWRDPKCRLKAALPRRVERCQACGGPHLACECCRSSSPPPPPAAPEDLIRAGLETQAASSRLWRERLEKAEAEIARLRAELTTLKQTIQPPDPDEVVDDWTIEDYRVAALEHRHAFKQFAALERLETRAWKAEAERDTIAARTAAQLIAVVEQVLGGYRDLTGDEPITETLAALRAASPTEGK